ncbi:hypothetical protein ACQKGC_26070 [Allorhizobium pseudoryzae]|uniref:hypothetical protein n=1 Tax=Allorhizobium pseudoryzae TaxID=379684 RepID=UPI003D092B84
MLIGYARVSKGDEQSNKAQACALSDAGCARADSELKPAGIPINYRPPFRFEAGHDSNQLSAVFRL